MHRDLARQGKRVLAVARRRLEKIPSAVRSDDWFLTEFLAARKREKARKSKRKKEKEREKVKGVKERERDVYASVSALSVSFSNVSALCPHGLCFVSASSLVCLWFVSALSPFPRPWLLSRLNSALPPTDYALLHIHLFPSTNTFTITCSPAVQVDVKAMTRNETESKLELLAFLVLSTPLKKDTASSIRRLVQSSHYVVMITGSLQAAAAHGIRQTYCKRIRNETEDTLE